jgi:hypothetical protein
MEHQFKFFAASCGSEDELIDSAIRLLASDKTVAGRNSAVAGVKALA